MCIRDRADAGNDARAPDGVGSDAAGADAGDDAARPDAAAVSYTHLTLPPSDLA